MSLSPAIKRKNHAKDPSLVVIIAESKPADAKHNNILKTK